MPAAARAADQGALEISRFQRQNILTASSSSTWKRPAS
jgi:hypothetical protein